MLFRLLVLSLVVGGVAGCSTSSPAPAPTPAVITTLQVTDMQFPAVYQAWNGPAENLPDTTETLAKHDLVWHNIGAFGYTYPASGFRAMNQTPALTSMPHYDLSKLRSLNPRIRVLGAVQWHDLPPTQLPDNDPWWMKDKNGQRIPSWGPNFLLDINNASLQDHVAAVAKALMATGKLDGIMLDWCGAESHTPAITTIIKKVRDAIGSTALLIVNGGYQQLSLASMGRVNGIFMENAGTQWPSCLGTLKYNESHARKPTANCYNDIKNIPTPSDARVRMVTCAVATLSNAYVLVPHYTNVAGHDDHSHLWYSTWDTKLGKTVGSTYKSGVASCRDFENGTAVYNPVGSPVVTVKGKTVSGGDGAIVLK